MFQGEKMRGQTNTMGRRARDIWRHVFLHFWPEQEILLGSQKIQRGNRIESIQLTIKLITVGFKSSTE